MTRLRALTEAGLLHPNPDAVLAPLFTGGSGFFLASDKVQVKYEMLRARLVEGVPVSETAAAHGYSRAAFYLVAAAFDQSGMAGLVDERRGRRGPVKLRRRLWTSSAPTPGRGPDRRAGRRPVRGAVAPAHTQCRSVRPLVIAMIWSWSVITCSAEVRSACISARVARSIAAPARPHILPNCSLSSDSFS